MIRKGNFCVFNFNICVAIVVSFVLRKRWHIFASVDSSRIRINTGHILCISRARVNTTLYPSGIIIYPNKMSTFNASACVFCINKRSASDDAILQQCLCDILEHACAQLIPRNPCLWDTDHRWEPICKSSYNFALLHTLASVAGTNERPPQVVHFTHHSECYVSLQIAHLPVYE